MGKESNNYLAAFQVKIRAFSVPGTTLVQRDPRASKENPCISGFVSDPGSVSDAENQMQEDGPGTQA